MKSNIQMSTVSAILFFLFIFILRPIYEPYLASPSFFMITFSSGIILNEKIITKSFGDLNFLSYIYTVNKDDKTMRKTSKHAVKALVRQKRKEYRKNNPKKYNSLDKVFIFFGYITMIIIIYKLIVLISPK